MFYCLECKAVNISCEFWVNDLPVTKRGLDHGERLDGPINQYLVEGINELCLEIAPPAPDGLADDERWYASAPPGAEITAAIIQYPFGAVVGGPDGTVRAEVRWQTADLQQGCMWPLCLTTTFDLGIGLGPMCWQRADELDLDDPATIDGAMGLLRTLHAHLEAGDHEAWLDLHDDRLGDFDRIYPGQAGDRRRRARRELIETRKKGLHMAPLNEDTSSWRLCGEGKVIECVCPDGYPNIREQTTAKGTTDSYPVMAGKLNGRWVALR